MRFLRNLISNLGKRRYAQVHDVRVEYSRYPAKDILEQESSEGNMSQSLNGKLEASHSIKQLKERCNDPVLPEHCDALLL